MKSLLDRFYVVAGAVLLLAVLSLHPFAASAQTAAATAEYKIDFRPLLDQVVWPLVGVAVTALAGWLATKASGWLKLSSDTMVRGYLETALQNAVEYARARTADVPLGVGVKSQVVATAANYAIAHVPDALKRFNIDEAALKRLLTARLESSTAVPVVASPPADKAS